jgi:hypothetical protein
VICFNSARANDTTYDILTYEKYRDYILGKEQINNRLKCYVMFLDLNLSVESEHEYYHLQDNREYEIDSFRIALLRLDKISMYNCAARTVIINSFAFLILAYNENASEKEIQNVEKKLIESYPKFSKLYQKNRNIN